jgi:hypothetical protein
MELRPSSVVSVTSLVDVCITRNVLHPIRDRGMGVQLEVRS